ncbi:MAG: FtsW/RodA/SpoVE family cell cycle protein [Bacillota bacterium]|nr:FtsW/RodA/SpoVE family cell cycle protein [Bacillota bacterium]
MLRLLNYKHPVNLLVAVDIIAFGLLCYHNSSKAFDWKTLLAGVIISVLFCITYLIIVKKGMGDEYLFLIVAMLSSLGFIMIYRLDNEAGFRQFIWLLLGISLFFLSYFAFIKIKTWSKFIYFYIGASFLLYILTLVLGTDIGGSKNWIIVGGFRFQPSEIIKVLFILFLACYFKDPDSLRFPLNKPKFLNTRLGRSLFLMAAVYMNVAFLFLQGEWGTVLLFLLVFLAEVYVFDKGKVLMLVNSAAIIICAAAGYFLVYHIKVRFDIWLNPWADISGKGYQIAQSLFAIAAGGFFGTGIGSGRPDLIPAVNTDFIFSAISEEMGIFGGMAVILLFFILAYRGFKIVMKVEDKFNKALALGIAVQIGIQTFIIIGGVTKLVPLTGITLPFISYGGSSLVTSFILLGLLQALSSGKAQRSGGVDKLDRE